MPLPRGYQFYKCPGCSKKGVYLKLRVVAGESDCWVCKYCDWDAFSSGENDSDRSRRRDLANFNPERGVWVSDLTN